MCIRDSVKSLQFAIERLGQKAILTDDPFIIKEADKIIFPGQGEASNAMDKLRKHNLDKIIPSLKQPILGICLGMQLFFDKTEEKNTIGLGIINGTVAKFPNSVKIPQMGWNVVHHDNTDLFEGINNKTYMYLVHSYYAPKVPESVAFTNYGLNYSVAVRTVSYTHLRAHETDS